MARLCVCVVCLLLLVAMPMTAQAPGLSEMYALIRAEETNNSKIMWIIHEIADVSMWPRVTGTPEFEGRGRLGGRDDDDVLGTGERAFGAVDMSAADRGHASAGLGEHGAFGGSGYALSWATDGHAAGLDAQYERSGDGEGGDAAAAGIGAAYGRGI